MTTHTPGPWSVSIDFPTSSGLAINDVRGRVIAIAKHVPQADGVSSACEANAARIAAAPAMLAILRKVAVALDMADNESYNFADCQSDVVQHLLENAGPDLMRLFIGLGEDLDGSGPASEGES